MKDVVHSCANQTVRDRWTRLMENAFGGASLPSKAEEVLRKFFDEMSTFMINHSESGSGSAKRCREAAYGHIHDMGG